MERPETLGENYAVNLEVVDKRADDQNQNIPEELHLDEMQYEFYKKGLLWIEELKKDTYRLWLDKPLLAKGRDLGGREYLPDFLKNLISHQDFMKEFKNRNVNEPKLYEELLSVLTAKAVWDFRRWLADQEKGVTYDQLGYRHYPAEEKRE